MKSEVNDQAEVVLVVMKMHSGIQHVFAVDQINTSSIASQARFTEPSPDPSGGWMETHPTGGVELSMLVDGRRVPRMELDELVGSLLPTRVYIRPENEPDIIHALVSTNGEFLFTACSKRLMPGILLTRKAVTALNSVSAMCQACSWLDQLVMSRSEDGRPVRLPAEQWGATLDPGRADIMHWLPFASQADGDTTPGAGNVTACFRIIPAEHALTVGGYARELESRGWCAPCARVRDNARGRD
jgi:hypothetical protein